jgi:hypothetical protein
MLLTDKSPKGEPLFECDACRTVGEIGNIFVDEQGSHHCLPCWCERNLIRAKQRRPAVVER